MKRTGVLLTVVVAVVCLCSANLALAAGETLTVKNIKAWSQSGSGGPFSVQPNGFVPLPYGMGQHGAGANEFITFCVETNEFLSNNQTSYVEFSNSAMGGGVAGGNPDPLSIQAAYLYQEFILGNLDTAVAGFTYGAALSGDALQQTIWLLEQEITNYTGSTAQKNLSTALQNYANANAAANYQGKVKVMRLWKYSNFTGARQDLLVMIPLPMPAGMALAGLLGIGVVAGVRRRMRS